MAALELVYAAAMDMDRLPLPGELHTLHFFSAHNIDDNHRLVNHHFDDSLDIFHDIFDDYYKQVIIVDQHFLFNH